MGRNSSMSPSGLKDIKGYTFGNTTFPLHFKHKIPNFNHLCSINFQIQLVLERENSNFISLKSTHLL